MANRKRSQLSILIIVLICLLNSGCVQRRLLIRSEPDGALVTVDDRAVGHTPFSLPYVYYGTRKIKLEKDGYQTVNVKEKIAPPPYQWPLLNFFSDNFAFREIRDIRAVDFKLIPKAQTNEDELLERANELRQNVYRDTIISPGG